MWYHAVTSCHVLLLACNFASHYFLNLSPEVISLLFFLVLAICVWYSCLKDAVWLLQYNSRLFALSCPIMSCPCPALPCPPYLALSCPVVSCLALSYPILSCPALPCPALPCPALSRPALSFLSWCTSLTPFIPFFVLHIHIIPPHIFHFISAFFNNLYLFLYFLRPILLDHSAPWKPEC